MFSRLRDKEYSLNLLEALLLGLFAAVVVFVSYTIGFKSGSQSGFDLAMEDATSFVSRIPLDSNLRKAPSVEDISKVYSQLSDVEEDVSEEKIKKEKTAKGESLIEEKDLLPKDNKIEEVVEDLKPSLGWYVQVSTHEAKKDALSSIEKLKEVGFPAVIEAVEDKKSKYYRVLSGPEKTKVYADRLQQQIKIEKLITGPSFVREYKNNG